MVIKDLVQRNVEELVQINENVSGIILDIYNPLAHYHGGWPMELVIHDANTRDKRRIEVSGPNLDKKCHYGNWILWNAKDYRIKEITPVDTLSGKLNSVYEMSYWQGYQLFVTDNNGKERRIRFPDCGPAFFEMRYLKRKLDSETSDYSILVDNGKIKEIKNNKPGFFRKTKKEIISRGGINNGKILERNRHFRSMCVYCRTSFYRTFSLGLLYRSVRCSCNYC